MARILYGVCGEGAGHSSRAKEVIEHLESKGHIVKVISYDKGYKNLKPFFDVEKISGLRLVYKNNQVQYLSTSFKNIFDIAEGIRSVRKVLKMTNEFSPQLIFSDFEPISAIVANLKKLPLISLGNHHFLTRTKIKYPPKYEPRAIAAKAITRVVTFKARAYLVTTFTKTKITKRRTFLFPPILRKEIFGLKPEIKDYILVYLTSRFEGLIEILKQINKKFVVYGFEQNKKEKNIIFKKASRKGFLKDLANCQGIVANAGFTLITEALYLGKPYLALPAKGQFEQVVNAFYLEKLGYGKFWDELDKEKIESFLYNLDLYRDNLKRYKREDNSKIFEKIDSLIEKYCPR